jgi:hypothetical protein
MLDFVKFSKSPSRGKARERRGGEFRVSRLPSFKSLLTALLDQGCYEACRYGVDDCVLRICTSLARTMEAGKGRAL